MEQAGRHTRSLMSPLGLAIAGPVADALGAGVWFVVDGLACTPMGAGAFFVPTLVHLEDNHAHAQEATSQATEVEPAQPGLALSS